ncbi:MAG: capsular polysaccharide biosynthesis protein [Lachnospiraceae bacterium]|nr:capsular polysaccharide biosynthesis protein [Lachnospiraceae bacterium]
MSIIDFHSHILPGIDDGSADVDTSLQMLSISQSQGVDRIVASSHFYAEKEGVDAYLQRRQSAYEALMAARTDAAPEIIPGAEVYFFTGISQAEATVQLCIEGTNLMLLEMPFATWSSSVIDEVQALIQKRGIRIIIAHLELYLHIPGNSPWIDRLLELPVIVQINAGSLLDWRTRRPLITMFKNGTAHLLGSDCHDLHRRSPNLAKGRAVLEKKLGSGILQQMDWFGQGLFPY